MSEIIWAMNSKFDDSQSLIAYTRRYAQEILNEHYIDLEFNAEIPDYKMLLSGEKRRNIFLIVKEVFT